MANPKTALILALIMAFLATGCTAATTTAEPVRERNATIATTATSEPPAPTTQIAWVDCLRENAVVETAIVTDIVDGDTVEVTIDGAPETVRYIGIDTPERGDPYYRDASERNGALVLGKEVLLVKDVSETDRYERLLRYVFVDSTFINEALVREGYATAKEYRPDTACADVLSAAQRQAEADRAGIWGVEVPALAATATVTATTAGTAANAAPTGTPAPTKAAVPTATTASAGCPTGCVEPLPGCEIKGNINREGEKIYHVPGGEFYSRTQINPSNGERWFCTVDEAVVNGWWAPRN